MLVIVVVGCHVRATDAADSFRRCVAVTNAVSVDGDAWHVSVTGPHDVEQRRRNDRRLLLMLEELRLPW